MTKELLIKLASHKRLHAYAPYSRFYVGAVVLGSDGMPYMGCNVENSSYGNCVCAEKAAICKAVSHGVKDFEAIAIVGGDAGDLNPEKPCLPCGSCLQFMSEFCGDDFKIYVKDSDVIKEYTLGELMPKRFKL